MKNTKWILTFILALILALSLAACNKDELWEDALYTEDVTLGEGEKKIELEIKAGEKSILVTINTDADTLGEVLREHKLVEGDETEFGLFIKKVNGIRADYDLDGGYYWGSFKDGEYLMSGVDTTNILDGEHYELVRTK